MPLPSDKEITRKRKKIDDGTAPPRCIAVAAGRESAMRRVRKPSSVVRDILGGNMMGGGGMEDFALAAANLLGPTARIEKEPPAKGGECFPRSSKSRSKPAVPALADDPQGKPQCTGVKDEEAPSSIACVLSEAQELGEPKAEPSPAPSAHVADNRCKASPDDLMVEISPASSPQPSSLEVYVALAEEPSESNEGEDGMNRWKEEESPRPDPDRGVNSRATSRSRERESGIKEEATVAVRHDKTGLGDAAAEASVGGGRGGGADKVKVHCKERLGKLPEGARGVRTLADVYCATGGELPCFAGGKKGRGAQRKLSGRERAVGELDKSDEGDSRAAGLERGCEDEPSGSTPSTSERPLHEVLSLKGGVDHLPDSDAGLQAGEVNTLAGMMEEKAEKGGPKQGADEAKMVAGNADSEEEVDEAVAWTLLDLAGQCSIGVVRAPQRASNVQWFGEGVDADAQAKKVPRPSAGQLTKGASSQPPRKVQARKRPQGGLLRTFSGRGGGRWSSGRPTALHVAGGSSGALGLGIKRPHPEEKGYCMTRTDADASRDVPRNNAWPVGAHVLFAPVETVGRRRDVQGADAEESPKAETVAEKLITCGMGEDCGLDARPGKRSLGTGADGGYGWRGHGRGTPKARLIAEQVLMIGGDIEAGEVSAGGGYRVSENREGCILAVGRPLVETGADVGSSNALVATSEGAMPLPVRPLLGEENGQVPSVRTRDLQGQLGVISEDSSATESDVSAGHDCVVGRVETVRDSRACCQGGVLHRLRVGQAGSFAEGGRLECGRASLGAQRHRVIGGADGQAIVAHRGSHDLQLSSKRPEDILLLHLQADPRRQAAALQRIMRAGGLAGWLDTVGLTQQAEHLERRAVTAEQIVAIRNEDARRLELRVGSRVRLMAAILDLYRP